MWFAERPGKHQFIKLQLCLSINTTAAKYVQSLYTFVLNANCHIASITWPIWFIYVSLWLFSPKMLRRGETHPRPFLYVQETAKFCGCTLKILLLSAATWATIVLTDACPRQLHVTAMNIIHVTATSGKKEKNTSNSMWIPYYIIFYPEHTSGAFFKRIPPTKTLYHVQLGIFGSALVICTSSGRIHYCAWLKNPCWLSISTQHLNRRFWRCSKEFSSIIRSSKWQISM